MNYFQELPAIHAALLPFRKELDERGLLPLDVARTCLRSSPPTPTTREEADRMWASVLSLEDAEDLIASTSHLTWDGLVPGQANTALVDRYGEALIDWLETRVRDGVLLGKPHVLGQCLTRLKTTRALELLLQVEGYAGDSASSPQAQRLDLLYAWVGANVGAATLPLFDHVKSLPDPGDPLRVFKTIILSGPVSTFERIRAARGAETEAVFERLKLRRALTPEVPLRMLDDASQRPTLWPRFCFGDDDRSEYFGLRLILGRERDGDSWGLVLERLEDATPDGLGVQRYGLDGFGMRRSKAYVDLEITRDDSGATRVNGPGGEVVFSAEELRDEALLPALSTEPAASWALRRNAIRAYLERFPGALWPAPEDALTRLSAPGLEPLVVSTEFTHVTGDDARPSETDTYRTAIDALVSGDPTRFVPGPSNTSWRLHATHHAKS